MGFSYWSRSLLSALSDSIHCYYLHTRRAELPTVLTLPDRHRSSVGWYSSTIRKSWSRTLIVRWERGDQCIIARRRAHQVWAHRHFEIEISPCPAILPPVWLCNTAHCSGFYLIHNSVYFRNCSISRGSNQVCGKKSYYWGSLPRHLMRLMASLSFLPSSSELGKWLTRWYGLSFLMTSSGMYVSNQMRLASSFCSVLYFLYQNDATSYTRRRSWPLCVILGIRCESDRFLFSGTGLRCVRCLSDVCLLWKCELRSTKWTFLWILFASYINVIGRLPILVIFVK